MKVDLIQILKRERESVAFLMIFVYGNLCIDESFDHESITDTTLSKKVAKKCYTFVLTKPNFPVATFPSCPNHNLFQP